MNQNTDGSGNEEQKQLDQQENEQQWKATRFYSHFQRAKEEVNPLSWESSFVKQTSTEGSDASLL